MVISTVDEDTTVMILDNTERFNDVKTRVDKEENTYKGAYHENAVIHRSENKGIKGSTLEQTSLQSGLATISFKISKALHKNMKRNYPHA